MEHSEAFAYPTPRKNKDKIAVFMTKRSDNAAYKLLQHRNRM